jgi:hypothetical protein
MKSYVIIFCLLSLFAKSQTWQKIGSFNGYPGHGEHNAPFDFNNFSNKLYSSFVDSNYLLTIKEYNGLNWADVSPTPKFNPTTSFSSIPKLSLKCSINNNNVYFLTRDSFLVYNGSSWIGYTLPNTTSADETGDLEIAINPISNNPYIARLISVNNVGSVLRIDEFVNNSWNFIDSVTLNNSFLLHGIPDFISFKYNPNGEAYVSAVCNDDGTGFRHSIYHLNNSNLTHVATYQILSAQQWGVDSYHYLFYNYASGNMNLVTIESKIYELIGNTITTLHTFPTPFYNATAYITPNNENYVFSGAYPGFYTNEIHSYDSNYNLTPLDQPNFELVDAAQFTYDNANDILYVTGGNYEIEPNGPAYTVTLSVYKLDNTTTKIKEKNSSYSISIFPNPAKNVLYLKTKQKGNLNYEITNTMGQTIKTGNLKNEFEVNISDMDNGIYFITLKEGSENIYNSKFIIQ